MRTDECVKTEKSGLSVIVLYKNEESREPTHKSPVKQAEKSRHQILILIYKRSKFKTKFYYTIVPSKPTVENY